MILESIAEAYILRCIELAEKGIPCQALEGSGVDPVL
jgi:hypothetical protein